MSFSELGLKSSIASAVTEKGYNTPTPIQAKTIPVILKGRDVIAAAQTGTGKTAGFVLPILQQLDNGHKLRGKRIRSLILVPTRELAIQVHDNVVAYAKNLSLTSMAMYGGTDIDAQKQRLIEGVDVLVATPGRLLDMAHQRALHFDELKILVLDEADRMLDMGFSKDIYDIIDRLPQQRQNLLFSATMSDDVQNLGDDLTHYGTNGDVIEIRMSAKNEAASSIEQWLITVDKDTRSALLSHLIKGGNWDQALIFTEQKHVAAKLVAQLGKRGIEADCIHADRSQAQREKVLAQFKSGKLKYLVATGVAARGIDIGKLSRVVNYDLPFKPEEYIHRIGRTGRAGAAGEAISLVTWGDFKKLCAIESSLGHLIERREVEAFPVRKTVPISILNYVPKNQRR
ncbi:superfamily II DNA/RNA helicase [Umboniibacter marinipuniceus]|uniref:DEAD-box ATP-dependent RNA helicase RhpA n=1 Tax=Umboniibacter marinipuniceus TaxID=569599 RepID=A0A3M0ABR4_9GAMM|nr:DEAD/DEAH box helicase [Umboniibacter marinipuniceus]RMA82601.1 superfamily II DNA/RNA helicase [Umboniibacter marinipuniceus]